MIQQYGNAIAEAGFNATSTAGLVLTRASTNLATSDNLPNGLPASIWGYAITNNDAAAILYISYRTPTATKAYRVIGPGVTWEVSADVGLLRKLSILSSIASSAATVTILQ